MTDLDVLKELLDLFGGAIHATSKQKEHHKQSWVWGVNGDAAESVMLEVRPFMFERRKRAIDSVLDRWQGAKQEKIRQRDDFRRRVTLAAKEYAAGGTSLKAASAKYGVSQSSIRQQILGGRDAKGSVRSIKQAQ